MTDRDKIVKQYCDRIKSPQTAIRAFCVQCMGGYTALVKTCPSEQTCPLWPFRMGKNPLHAQSKGKVGGKVENALEFLEVPE